MRPLRTVSLTAVCLSLTLTPVTSATASYTHPQILGSFPFATLTAGKTVFVPVTSFRTDINAAADLLSDSPTICTVSPGGKGWKVRAIKVGDCRLRVYMPGMKGKFPSATKRFTVKVIAP